MTSIVITPFDPDHAEELMAFIENELDNADFEGEDMPSLIRIMDVTALSRQRDRLLAALNLIQTDKDGDGFICREAMQEVREAIDASTQENA